MGKRCCYGSCNSDSRYYGIRDDMKNVIFIPFPKPAKQNSRCQRWLDLCGRKDLTIDKVNRNTYICGNHFVGGNGPTETHPDPLPAFYTELKNLKRIQKGQGYRNRKKLRWTDRESFLKAQEEAVFSLHLDHDYDMTIYIDTDDVNPYLVEETNYSFEPTLISAGVEPHAAEYETHHVSHTEGMNAHEMSTYANDTVTLDNENEPFNHEHESCCCIDSLDGVDGEPWNPACVGDTVIIRTTNDPHDTEHEDSCLNNTADIDDIELSPGNESDIVFNGVAALRVNYQTRYMKSCMDGVNDAPQKTQQVSASENVHHAMELHICGGGKRYCVLCSHYQGQILHDETKIILRRLRGGSGQDQVKRRSL